MLVQYVRKTQAVHRPHKYSSGEAGLIFTDGLALCKSLPFPAPLLLPTHHLPCLFRSQAFWGSRLCCLVLWGYSYETFFHVVELISAGAASSTELMESGGWEWRVQGTEQQKGTDCSWDKSGFQGPYLKCLWRRSDADYAQWPICLSVHGNLILSPLDSIDLHSGDWFQGHKAYGWGCACSWTWDLM